MRMHAADMYEHVHMRNVVRMERSTGTHARMLCECND
jgi:hypothetical protein